MKGLLRYVATAGLGLAVALTICITRGLFSMTAPADIYHVLCDAFFVPAVYMLCIAGLAYVSSNGVFYALGYAIKTLFSVHNWSKKNRFSERQSYGDYVEEKRGKVSKFPSTLLWTGLVLLGISIIFMALFNQHYVPKA